MMTNDLKTYESSIKLHKIGEQVTEAERKKHWWKFW